MPRRGNVPKREILPDPIYNSVLVTKLVNSIMLDGKKGVAQKVVYGAFDMVKEKTGNYRMEVAEAAMLDFFMDKFVAAVVKYDDEGEKLDSIDSRMISLDRKSVV